MQNMLQDSKLELKPINGKIYDKTFERYKYWNNYEDMHPEHKYEVHYTVGELAYANSNFLNITSNKIPNIVITLENHISDFACFMCPGIKSLKILKPSYGNKDFEDNLLVILSKIPASVEEIDLSQIRSRVKTCITPFLPSGLKKYKTARNSCDQLENLPFGLEYLKVWLNYNFKYNFNFLPSSLVSLCIKSNDLDNRLENLEFGNLPISLKELYLDYYNFKLINLPPQLEKLIIENYFMKCKCISNRSLIDEASNESYLDVIVDEEYFNKDLLDHHKDCNCISVLPDSLKVFQIIEKCQGLYIEQYPPGLEYIDVDKRLNLVALPASVKGVGLYGYNLADEPLDLPANITTIYTSCNQIKSLPQTVKKLIIITENLDDDKTIEVKIGDVVVETSFYNTDNVFHIQ